MKYLQILVETDSGLEQLDLYDAREFPLSLDYQIEDVDDAVKKKSSGSGTTFSIPATKHNRQIFNNWGDAHSINDEAIQYRSAIIKDNGLPIGTGRMKIIDADTSSAKTKRKPSSYEIAFFLDNADWSIQMQNLELKDLPFTDYQFTAANVLARFDDNSLDNGVALIKWKQWDDIIAGNPAPNHVSIFEFTPHIYLKDVFSLAFAEVGYSLDSVLFATDYWENLIIPIAPKEYGAEYGQTYLDAKAGISGATLNIIPSGVGAGTVVIPFNDTVGGGYDAGGNWSNVTNQYSQTLYGTYLITLQVAWTNVVNQPITVQSNINGTITTSPIYPVGAAGAYELTTEVTFSAPTVLSTMIFSFVQSGGGTPVAQIQGVTGFVEIKAIRTPIQENVQIDWNLLIPEGLKVIDCIADCDLLHNLMFYTDTGAGTVRIEQRDSAHIIPDDKYYAGFFSSDRLDWSQKRDLLPVGNEKPKTNLKENFKLLYLDDSNDGTAKAMEEVNGTLQTANYQFPSGRYDEGFKQTKLKFFSKTVHLKDKTIQGQNITYPVIPQIPVLTKEDHNTGDIDDNDYSQKPRLLWKRLSDPQIDGAVYLVSSTGGAPATSNWPKSFAVNYDDTTGKDPNLSFGDETLIDASVTKGMLHRFWLKKLATYRSGKILKDWFNLTATDIQKMDFSSKILMDGLLYVLIKIEGYSPIIDSSSETYLLTDMDVEQEDVDAVTFNNVQSLISD